MVLVKNAMIGQHLVSHSHNDPLRAALRHHDEEQRTTSEQANDPGRDDRCRFVHPSLHPVR